MVTWDDARFLHTLLVPFLAPPDVVCILSTSRRNLEIYDTAEVWKALAKASFGPLGGSRGHRSRRQRKKKTTWRSGDGAKARLSSLWLEQVQRNITLLERGHESQRKAHEQRRRGIDVVLLPILPPYDGSKVPLNSRGLLPSERAKLSVRSFNACAHGCRGGHPRFDATQHLLWILEEAATVMRSGECAAGRSSRCSHANLRMWTSTTIVAAKLSSRAHETAPIQSGVRCDRCKAGPILGACFRCAAGCEATGFPMVTRARQAAAAAAKAGETLRSLKRWSAQVSLRSGSGCYTLCEACFESRAGFHPPHPFARLSPGFADVRLSGPALYEAVCGDCSYGCRLLVRPLKSSDVRVGAGFGGDLWALPVRVEPAGPLPLSQVKMRMFAVEKQDFRGVAFAPPNRQARENSSPTRKLR